MKVHETTIETHAEKFTGRTVMNLCPISGESVKEAKHEKTKLKHMQKHMAEQYEPVKSKPISTKVFYKGKELSKRQADSLASEMAKEVDQSKLGK